MSVDGLTSTYLSFRAPSAARERGIHNLISVDMDCGLAAARRPGMTSIRCNNLPQQVQLAANGNFRRGLVGGDDELELVAGALPLARDQRGLGDVLHRRAGPLHRTDNGAVVGCYDRIQDGLWFQALGALEDVDGDFEQRVLEADRLRPWSPGGSRI